MANETKAPEVESAPTKAEVKAAADQSQVDRERGYREVEWNGQKLFQSLATGHTTASEYEMVQYHAGLHHANIAIA